MLEAPGGGPLGSATPGTGGAPPSASTVHEAPPFKGLNFRIRTIMPTEGGGLLIRALNPKS